MRHFSLVLILAMALALAADALPSCAGPPQAVLARVERVEKNGAVVLTDHRIVHLEGIRLPERTSRGAPQPFADQALSAIKALMTAPLQLAVPPPARDRYSRVRAQVSVGGRWIQGELLSRGLARVEVAPDRIECATELFSEEARARSAHLGLWAAPAYAIRAPPTVGRGDVDTFQIVEGKVLNTSVKNGRAYLNFGADWHSDFTATVDPVDMPNFRATGVDPRSYVGQTIRVRGWVQFHNGPEIEVANPQGIEVVQ